MEPSQATKGTFEELLAKPLTDSEVAEMVSNLTLFVEMLAEIDNQQKELSNNKHNAKA